MQTYPSDEQVRIQVTTTGDLDDLTVTDSNIPEDQMEFLLQTYSFVPAVNQDGLHVHLMFDMDEQSIIVTPVEG